MSQSTSEVSTSRVIAESPQARRTRRRSAGEGSVYENGGRWRGAVTWTDAAGTRHRRTVTGRTAAEARGKLDALRQELKLGVLDGRKDPTVAEYLEPWLLRYRMHVRPATWRMAESHVRVYLLPAFGTTALRNLTPQRVEAALAQFLENGRPGGRALKPKRGRPARPVSPMTVRHVRGTLRRALADAMRDGFVGRNAAAAARPPRAPRSPIVYLSAQDARKLLAATADDRFGPLYALAVTTGLRLGELLGLTWGDIVDGRLRVSRSYARADGGGWADAEPKTGRSRRTLPIPETARRALETQRTRQRFVRSAAGSAWQDHVGRIFTDEVGRPIEPGVVGRGFRKVCRAAGVPEVRFHDLRHTAATLMLAQGVPLAVISEWLGHAGIQITADTYAAIVPELHVEAADAMDRAIGGAS